MAFGPGKYDDLCTKARTESKAIGVAVLVFKGEYGSGFSVQTESLEMIAALPNMLRGMATEIEQSSGQG